MDFEKNCKTRDFSKSPSCNKGKERDTLGQNNMTDGLDGGGGGGGGAALLSIHWIRRATQEENRFFYEI